MFIIYLKVNYVSDNTLKISLFCTHDNLLNSVCTSFGNPQWNVNLPPDEKNEKMFSLDIPQIIPIVFPQMNLNTVVTNILKNMYLNASICFYLKYIK